MESVAVIILTKDNIDVLFHCLDSFILKNTYKNIKFYIGDTGSTTSNLKIIENYLQSFPYKKEFIKFSYYNFSKNNNWIINNRVKEKYVLLCNNDITLKNDALTLMVNEIEEGVSTIGCKLLYPDNTIQHGGHIHFYNSSSNQYEVTHKNLREPDKKLPHEYNVGNTFAFSLIKKEVYDSINGLNESYEHCFEDVDFCIESSIKKYKHKFVGSAICFHHESLTRKNMNTYISSKDIYKIRKKLYNLYNK